MTRWRNAALIETTDDEGEQVLIEGRWDPIVEPDKLKQVREHFAGKRGGNAQRDARKHLLSNLARCGRCGSWMRFGRSTIKGKLIESYRCHASHTGGKCAIGINAAVLEGEVTRYVVGRLALPDRAILQSTADERAKIVALRSEREELASDDTAIMESRIKPSQKAAPLESNEGRRQEIDVQLVRLASRDALTAMLLDLSGPEVAIDKRGAKRLPFDLSDRAPEGRARPVGRARWS